MTAIHEPPIGTRARPTSTGFPTVATTAMAAAVGPGDQAGRAHTRPQSGDGEGAGDGTDADHAEQQAVAAGAEAEVAGGDLAGSSAHTALGRDEQDGPVQQPADDQRVRTYRPPARRASTNRSREPTSTPGARHRATTAAMPTNDTAFNANTQPAPGRDDDPAERGSHRPGQVHADPVERGRLGQHRLVDQVGLDRLPGGPCDRVAARRAGR